MSQSPKSSGTTSQTTDPIVVNSVTQKFVNHERETILAVDNVSFSVGVGQFLAVIGPSGCGKTTVLNMLAGLLSPTSGEVFVSGRPVTKPSQHVGYITARDGLLPWLRAEDNVAFGLELRGVARAQRRKRAKELMATVGLAGFEKAYRTQLSQGMRQRVAIARTLAIDPEVLLLDEPFAALDAQTKAVLQTEFSTVWERSGTTILLVTHDLEEAVAMADRVIVMSARPGVITRDLRIDLPRPRDLNQIRFEPRFQELTKELWNSLEVEIGKVHV